MAERLLTAKEAAEYLRLSPGTLENYRCAGCGPPYIQRVRKGRVFYDRSQLDEWLSRQVRTSTSEAMQ